MQSTYPGAAHDIEWRRLVAPSDYVNPEPRPRYHLVVIGAGPAGLVTAIAAAGLGARVALVERNRMGGDCLNVGCVPSKALLEYSRHSGADFEGAYEWMRSVRARIASHDSVERYTEAGVDVFLGTARFVDDRTVTVGSSELRGRRFVIATGARAAIPRIPGLAESRPLTNESIFDLQAQPKTLAIIGAGPIGCELAQAMSLLGTEVHLLEGADRILLNESRDAAEAVAAALERYGVNVTLGARIESIERRGSQILTTTPAGQLATDHVLVAAGRIANTGDLNLAGAGVETDDAGRISVDSYLRTTNSRIFAAGDVCTPLQFTHHADAHARIVVQNALFLPTAKATKLVVPRCVYTDPELAQVGARSEELDDRRVAYDAYRVAYAETDRGRAQGDDEGFVELLVERSSGRILGATILGRDAGEQIAPVCLAMSNGLGIDSFSKTLMSYPTRSEALKRLADQHNRRKLTPAARTWLERWFRWSL